MKKKNYFAHILTLIIALFLLGSTALFSVSAANAPAAPSKVSATCSTTAIKLKWSAVKGASGYRIYYKLPGDTSWRTALKSTTKTTYTVKNLTAGQNYRFAVRGYTKSGDKTVWGKYKEIKTATLTPAPSKLTATQNTTSIKLTWSTVKSATGYRIYYKAASSSTWKTAVSSTKKTSYTFKNLTSGTKYNFRVRTYKKSDSGTVYGKYSALETATKPATVTAKIAKSTSTAVALSWNKVNADGYRIYYKINSGSWKTVVSSTTKTSYTIKNLSASKSYSFAVRPYVKTDSGFIWGDYKATKATKSYRIDRYNKIFESDTFLLKINDPDLGPTTIAVKNDRLLIEASMEGISIKMIYNAIINGKNAPKDTWYLVYDDFKKYAAMSEDMIGDMDADDLLEGIICDDENLSYSTSTETITLNGKKIRANVESCVDDGNKIKYYFNGDELVRIVTTTPDGITTTTEILEISTTVPNSLFTIPSGYGEMDISWLLAA